MTLTGEQTTIIKNAFREIEILIKDWNIQGKGANYAREKINESLVILNAKEVKP